MTNMDNITYLIHEITQKLLKLDRLLEGVKRYTYSVDKIDLDDYEKAYYTLLKYFGVINVLRETIDSIYHSLSFETKYLKRIVETRQEDIDIDISKYREEQRKKLEHLRKQKEHKNDN